MYHDTIKTIVNSVDLSIIKYQSVNIPNKGIYEILYMIILLSAKSKITKTLNSEENQIGGPNHIAKSNDKTKIMQIN